MKISGFMMVKNATKLYYPVKESIESILPICDEFIVALGDCDADDFTEQAIRSIDSNKIRIISTVWNLEGYPKGTLFAQQTDIAMSACTGDWLFYLQSDEVVHEKYLPTIQKHCEEFLHDKRVEGFIFNYVHFWGDYHHHVVSHGLYPYEIRIIRRDKDIHSWRDAQSFRRIPDFNGIDYWAKKGTRKLNVVLMDAYIYHYGFVRPPDIMKKKKRIQDNIHQSIQSSPQITVEGNFEYGDLGALAVFNETHPKVMATFIDKLNWADQLNFSRTDKRKRQSKKFKHEKWKYKLLTFIEQRLLGGKELFGFKNYNLLKVK
jgi:hypothetical protein